MPSKPKPKPAAKHKTPVAAAGGPVAGKVVVLTGKFSELDRAAASKQLAQLGAIIGKSVTAKTDMLIAGEKAGSKIAAAGRLGVEVKGEAWLMAVLSGVDPDGGAMLDASVTELDAAGLETLLANTDWAALDPARDLPVVLAALHRLEREQGVTALHRRFSEQVLSAAKATRVQHSRVHRNRLCCMALSPCGRYLATGSESPPANYDAGGSIAIWELASARVVNAIYDVDGGVGWSENADCIEWSPDGELLAAVYSTNVVGTFAPFDTRGGPLMSAGITNGWDSAPSFRISPDGQQICVACWGGESRLAGGLVSTRDGQRIWDDSPQVRWFSDAGVPESLELQNWRELGWHPDGWIYGHNSSHGHAYAVDASTRTLRWHTQVHAPVAFSPDGEFLAHNPAGLAIYDGRSGSATTQLPMIVGATQLLWSPVVEQRRLAMLVGPGNGFGADPGVHLFDHGELVATIHDTPLRDSDDWGFPDAKQLAFSPDGQRLALVTADQQLAIWSLADGGARQRTLAVGAGISGVFWGAEVLVAVGPNTLEFWDVDRELLLARHDLLPPPGLVDALPGEASWQTQLPGARSYLPVPDLDARRWRWVIARPEGPVVCAPEHVDVLDELLVFSLGGGRVGWPWRWAVGSDHALAITDPKQIEHKKIKSLWTRALRERGHEAGAGTGAGQGFVLLTLAAHKQDFVLRDLVARAQVAQVQLATAPLNEYHAPDPLYGERLTAKALAGLVGKSVLYAEDWRPRYVILASVLAVEGDTFSYYYKSGGGSGSGGGSIAKLAWIGEAAWIGGE